MLLYAATISCYGMTSHPAKQATARPLPTLTPRTIKDSTLAFMLHAAYLSKLATDPVAVRPAQTLSHARAATCAAQPLS